MSDFDPSDSTVEEVKEYVETNPDDVEDVLEKEKAGKNRSTLIEYLSARQGGVEGEQPSRQMVETDEPTSGKGLFPGDPNTYPDPDNPVRSY
jgi:hypothetical protein